MAHMRVLFVGGLKHGQTSVVTDDPCLIEFENPLNGYIHDLYHRHRLPRANAGAGIDVLFICSLLPLEEYELKIQEALTSVAI